MSGVTVRTLHHYDEIGLLVPSERTTAGYRAYSRGDAERLGHVLAYRACGVPLAEIRALLDDEDLDRAEHLRRQLALLRSRAADLDRQLQALTRAWEAATMGINLDPDEILEVFGEHDPTQYAGEAEERWGEHRRLPRVASAHVVVHQGGLAAVSGRVGGDRGRAGRLPPCGGAS